MVIDIKTTYKFMLNKYIYLILLFISLCSCSGRSEFIQETDEPIQLNGIILGRGEYRSFNPRQQINNYSIIHEIEYSDGRKKYSIIKEWFKKPRYLRREIISPGSIPEIIISDGKNTWTYLYCGPRVVFKQDHGLTPECYINKITQNNLAALRKELPVNEQNNEYQIEDQEISKAQKTILKVRLNKENLLPIYWELNTYNLRGQLEYEKTSKQIIYDTSFRDRLFRVPREFNTVKDNNNDMFSDNLNQDIIKKSENKIDSLNCDASQLMSWEIDLKGLLEKDPNIPEAYRDLGFIAIRRNDSVDAEELFQKAITYNKKYQQAYFALIDLFIYEKKKAAAKEWIEKAITVFPPESFLDFDILGNFYERAGYLDESISMFEQAPKGINIDLINIEASKKSDYEKKMNDIYKKKIEDLKERKKEVVQTRPQ